MQALLTETRLLASPPTAVFSEQLATLSERELATVERLLASSAHNRQVCAVGETLNAALALLPRFEEAPRRAIALRILRHLGLHRFTVHNLRFVLAQIMERLDLATEESEGEAQASAASSALELLQLMNDVIAGSALSAAVDLPAFWDMGVGVMGATGFDLPADSLVNLAAKGAFSISIWIRVEQLGASPTAVFGVADALGAGMQIQLQRASAGVAIPELLVTEPPRAASTASRLLSGRLGAALGGGGGGGISAGALACSFEGNMGIRCGQWHLITLSCRRGTMLSLGALALGGSSRDEALLSIDGSRAAKATNFRYPTLSTERAANGHAAVGAPATPRAPAAALRGQLGPFVLFESALSSSEAEGCYEAARTGKLLHEHARLLATWHPLISDRAAGACVAMTADGPWAARPRSESISVVEIVRARDSAGGILNLLLPLLSLRRRLPDAAAPATAVVDGDASDAAASDSAGLVASGDVALSSALRLVALMLRGHPRNQSEMLRSDGMLLLGHLLRTVAPENVGSLSVGALGALADACRDQPELYRRMLDQVLMRLDAWHHHTRRLAAGREPGRRDKRQRQQRYRQH